MERRTGIFVVLGVAAVIGLGRPSEAAITVHPRLGSATDWTGAPKGPGLIPMGGGSDVDATFVWMHDTIVGDTSPGGDVVVLRASGTNAYDSYFMRLARFNSVQTLVLVNPTAGELAMAAEIVGKAEAVWFAGGDQRNYIDWGASSTLMQAVQAVYDRGGVVGGTSAGMAILGEFAWGGGPDSAGAVANPTANSLTAVPLFKFPLLAGWHTDTHHMNRDRFGRTAALMAKTIRDGKATTRTFALACSEGSAVVIDKNGLGTYKEQGQNGGPCLVMAGGPATTIAPSSPLVYMNISVTRLDANNQTYDFGRRCGTTATYTVTVDGSNNPIYAPADPYLAAGAPGNPALCQANAAAPDAGATPPDAAGPTGTPDAAPAGPQDAPPRAPTVDAGARDSAPTGTGGAGGSPMPSAGTGGASGGTGGSTTAPPGTPPSVPSPSAGSDAGASTSADSGCSCNTGGSPAPAGLGTWLLFVLVGVSLWLRARSSRRHRRVR